MSMASIGQPVERRSNVELWTYVAIAAASVLTSPITVVFTLVIGVLVGLVGVFWAILSRSDRGSRRGARVLFSGLAVLAGPFLYITLAVGIRLVD